MKNTSRKPYIYKVTSFETGQYYIGSQCSGKTIGVNYFTSSTNKVFVTDFKNYGEEKYKITIVKTFADPDECGRAENYIIRNHMLLKDGLCLNKFYCCSGKKVFSRVGTHGWNKGIPRSEETKHKISLALKGRNKGTHLDEETKHKISTTMKGRNKGLHHSEETKQKMSKTLQGRPSPRRIKISIEGEVFNSLTEASKYYNVSVMAIRYWIKKNQHNVVYIEK